MKIFIAVSWLSTLGLAFLVGSHWHKPLSHTEHSELVKYGSHISNSPRVATSQETALSKSPTHNIAFVEQKQNQDENQSTRNQVINMFKGVYGQDLASIAAAYNLIINMSEDDLLSDLEYLKAYANDPEYSVTLSLYLDRYASIAPYKALIFALNSIKSPQSREGAINIALSKWSQKEPALALDWYNGNREELPSRFSPILSGIFANMAMKSKDLAIQLLQDYTDDRTELSLAISGITRNIKESGDFIDLLDKTAYLDSSSAQRSILNAWLRANPNGTLDWFSELPESIKKDKTEDLIFSSYMNDNASNAADWYLSRAESDRVQASAEKIIEYWSLSNPKDALEWVSRQTDIDAQQATKKLLMSSTYTDPSFVIDNLHLLESNRDKSDASTQIFAALKLESNEKAQMFFEDSPYQKEILKFETTMREYKKNKN